MSDRVRVAVFGAAGRMGAAVCAAVASSDDLELVAGVDPAAAGSSLADASARAGSPVAGEAASLELADSAAAASAAGAEVAVDFTAAAAARENLSWCGRNGVHAVCGTTGLSDEDFAELRLLFAGDGANCIVAPNFSIGAVLMMRAAELCAPYFPSVEIIELHHERKRDAPSGTALATVRRIEEAHEGDFLSDSTEHVTLAGTRGGVSEKGVRVHSVRLPGLVAHQEVIFGSSGETVTLRHDSTDRVSFMPGVLLAVRAVGRLPGLTVGLENVLQLQA